MYQEAPRESEPEYHEIMRLRAEVTELWTKAQLAEQEAQRVEEEAQRAATDAYEDDFEDDVDVEDATRPPAIEPELTVARVA